MGAVVDPDAEPIHQLATEPRGDRASTAPASAGDDGLGGGCLRGSGAEAPSSTEEAEHDDVADPVDQPYAPGTRPAGIAAQSSQPGTAAARPISAPARS